MRKHIDRLSALSLGLLLGLAATAWGATFNLFQPATGILVGSASTYVTTAATSSNVRALWSGTCNSGTFLRGDGACAAPSDTAPGGSTTQIQYNNAGAFGAEAAYTYDPSTNVQTITDGSWRRSFSSGAVDHRLWGDALAANQWTLNTFTDAGSATPFITATRTDDNRVSDLLFSARESDMMGGHFTRLRITNGDVQFSSDVDGDFSPAFFNENPDPDRFASINMWSNLGANILEMRSYDDTTMAVVTDGPASGPQNVIISGAPYTLAVGAAAEVVVTSGAVEVVNALTVSGTVNLTLTAYANDAAACMAGHVAGDLYRLTATSAVQIVVSC